MFLVGSLFALLRVFLNGFLYKMFEQYEDGKFLKGLPFQFVKIFLLVFGLIICLVAMLFTPISQLSVVTSIYAGFVALSVGYDVTKLIRLYNVLQEDDEEGKEKEGER